MPHRITSYHITIASHRNKSCHSTSHFIHPSTDISDKLSKAVKDLGDQNLEVKIRFIPLPRVEKMDVREQFWRLGIPVDMALMFYDPNLPQQPNARKLRSAFPKMKICLCGDDSHLQDALGIHGELQPSQWKLRHAIADDFIVNVCLFNIIIVVGFSRVGVR